MKIGELCRRTGLSHSRIRFYERVGLLNSVDREANGYRVYPPEAADVLELIKAAQVAGFSLDEIRSLLPDLHQETPEAPLEILRERVEKIEVLQKRLERSKAGLLAHIRAIGPKPKIPVPRTVYRAKSDEKGPFEEEIEEKMFGEVVIREVPKRDRRRR